MIMEKRVVNIYSNTYLHLKLNYHLGVWLWVYYCIFRIAYNEPYLELLFFNQKDSYASAVIPLGQDPVLREKYMTHQKTVRVGRLMEDLDVFAVMLCYQHVFNPKQIPGEPSPYSIVTALVDQIDLTATLRVRHL